MGEAYLKIDRKEALVYGHIRKNKGGLSRYTSHVTR